MIDIIAPCSRNRALALVIGVCAFAAPFAANAQSAAEKRAALLDPTRPFWSVHAPATVTADVETSRGTFTLELIREWAPRGADRFYNLARAGYYDDSRFFIAIS